MYSVIVFVIYIVFFILLGLLERRFTQNTDVACITWLGGLVPPVVWISGNEADFGNFRAYIAVGFFTCGVIAIYFYYRFAK